MSAQRIVAVRPAVVACIVAAASIISSSAAQAIAQLPSAFQVTLEETNQKTAELSTDELRQALRDGTSRVFEMDGVRYVWEGDRTAVFVDARSTENFAAGSLPGSRNIPLTDVSAAKDDGRLPMEDHNTRIVVFGNDAEQARVVAAELAKNAFHNVAFFNGTPHDIVAGLRLAVQTAGH